MTRLLRSSTLPSRGMLWIKRRYSMCERAITDRLGDERLTGCRSHSCMQTIANEGFRVTQVIHLQLANRKRDEGVHAYGNE